MIWKRDRSSYWNRTSGIVRLQVAALRVPLLRSMIVSKAGSKEHPIRYMQGNECEWAELQRACAASRSAASQQPEGAEHQFAAVSGTPGVADIEIAQGGGAMAAAGVHIPRSSSRSMRQQTTA